MDATHNFVVVPLSTISEPSLFLFLITNATHILVRNPIGMCLEKAVEGVRLVSFTIQANESKAGPQPNLKVRPMGSG